MKNFNWPVVGHQKIVKFLQKSLDNDKLTHAYLFSGKEHLGKTLLAENFAATILCRDYHEKNKSIAEFYPCQSCQICEQFKKAIHPDIYYLRKVEDKKNISIEQVRDMQYLLNMGSFLSSYKIAIIENAEDLSESAQNALLKLLEEPRPKTILIIIAKNSNFLLPTIVSRCQLINFLPVATEDIFDHLVKIGANREQAKMLSAVSCGQIGLAVDFFSKQNLFNEYLAKKQKFFSLLGSGLFEKFEVINSLLDGFETNQEMVDFMQIELDDWQLILRDILLIKNNTGFGITHLPFKESLEKLSLVYTSSHLIKLIKNIKQIKKYLTYNINPRLAVENLVITF